MNDDKSVYYAALQRRASHLSRAVNNPQGAQMPPTLVAFMLRGLIIAAIGYCGAELRDWWFGWFDEQVRAKFGLCQHCGRKKDTDDAIMCETCLSDCNELDIDAMDTGEGVH